MKMQLADMRKEPHWSYSSLNTFLNICSLQWAFRYVYSQEPQFTPVALVFGRAFHKALEYAAGLLKEGKEIKEATVATLFSDLLTQSCNVTEPKVRIPTGSTIDALSETGRKMVAAYLGDLPGDDTVLHVGQPFRVVLENGARTLRKPLIGEFDCVLRTEGAVTVVDWKTAARKWPRGKEHIDLQPTCYLYALRESEARFRFDIVTKTKTPSVEKRFTVRHPDHFARLFEMVAAVERAVRSEAFWPSEQSWACGNCPYGLACAGWHRERQKSLYNFRLVA